MHLSRYPGLIQIDLHQQGAFRPCRHQESQLCPLPGSHAEAVRRTVQRDAAGDWPPQLLRSREEMDGQRGLSMSLHADSSLAVCPADGWGPALYLVEARLQLAPVVHAHLEAVINRCVVGVYVQVQLRRVAVDRLARGSGSKMDHIHLLL